MDNEEFERKIEDLAEMLKSLRLIKDRGRKRWLKTEIKASLKELLKGD